MSIMEIQWKKYADIFVPAKPGSVQYDESKEAFFAGAVVVMGAVRAVGEPQVSEFAGTILLMAIEKELTEFGESVAKRARETIKKQSEQN